MVCELAYDMAHNGLIEGYVRFALEDVAKRLCPRYRDQAVCPDIGARSGVFRSGALPPDVVAIAPHWTHTSRFGVG